MEEHTATFEIESTADARTVARALDELYNRFREEDLAVREDDRATDEMLEEFEALQAAVDADSSGELVVTYRTGDGE